MIVQFKTDPAKIQIIKQSLANGGATANAKVFTADYSTAKKEVDESHANFKKFVAAQPITQIIGGKSVKSEVTIEREYSEAFNGVSLSVPSNLLTKIAESPEVASVWPVTEFKAATGTATQTQTAAPATGKMTDGLKIVGADKLQAEGNTGVFKSGSRAGQKVKVGVLDTGIDYNHPDLYKVTHDANGNLYGGHDFVNAILGEDGNVMIVDDHDPMETTYEDWEYAKDHPDPLFGAPPADYKPYITNHGTHVAGTIAANTTTNNETFSANGVAPDVELHGYRVLGPGGRGTGESVLAGIEESVKDHMDVINLSLGNTLNDPFYPTSVAINNATLSGVICAVAAGNAGPGQATVGSPGTSPLAITVGASSIPEEIAAMTLKFGTNSYPAHLFGKNFSQEDDEFKGQTISIVDVGSGKPADYESRDMTGKFALVKRGDGDYLTTKMANAKAAGAKGMIIWNDREDAETQGYIPNFLGVKNDNVYSISLTKAQGQALAEQIKANKDSASITFPLALDAPTIVKGDELASFSSTGPVKDWTIKPDIVAPGVDTWSTAPKDLWMPQITGTPDYKYSYQAISGTSMATPHVAGIIALVLAAHPEYTPADVKTILMNTAKDINTDSKTYSVYQVGAGRVDAYRAVHTDIKIQVLDKVNTIDRSNGPAEIKQIDNITGSLNFGFKGRGEGATNGSDDVVQSKDLNVVNQGTGNKTFNVSTEFLSTKFALSHKVGPGTGNDVKIDVSVNETKTDSLTVGGGATTKATAKITVPANAVNGTYEGYVNLVNANDASEHYRLPFTITVSEKGIDFKVDIKAMTGTERNTGNYNPNMGQPGSGYIFSVNSAMESVYILLKDKDGNYLGVVQNAMPIGGAGPGVTYGPFQMLSSGNYLPFTKDYNGTLDQSGISKTPAIIKDGSYSIEMVATDAIGNQYKKEDTLYVDYQAPTITMDQDSQPGIYEIDPTGWEPGQEIKGFHGKVYDSNIDRMKNNGETSVPDIEDHNKQAPVDQALNVVWGYQDGAFVTNIFRTDAEGRFHFGVTPEDITPKGSQFWIYPQDYAQAGDIGMTQQMYYFIKKGSPYLTLQSTGGVEPGLESQGKTVVQKDRPFNGQIAAKYALGMTGGSLTLNSHLYTFDNIRLSREYSDYLISKGITPPALTIGTPYDDSRNGGKSTDVTIPDVGAAGAIDQAHQNINLLDVDVTFKTDSPLVGPVSYFVLNSKLNLSGADTKVPTFMKNFPFVKAASSLITGGMFAESFRADSLSGSFTGITTASSGKVTVKTTDDTGKSFTTDSPTSLNNSIQYQGNQTGTYGVTTDVSDKPYSVELSMPGHFKGYQKTPVIGNNRFGYQSGSNYDFPSSQTPLLLGGDVNGDDVIDMEDLIAEITTYYNWKNLTSINNPVPANTAAKNAFLAANRASDIRWIAPGGFGLAIDYNDFYFIFKNFGIQNQSAISAGKSVPSPQLTVDQDTNITTPYGGSISLTAGDDLAAVMTKLNFAGPAQTTSGSTLPMLQDLQHGATISIVPNNNYILDDVVWRKAITKVSLGTTDVTNDVTIKEGSIYFDPQIGIVKSPSKITLPGSLFTAAGTYTVTIKATGYQDVTKSFTVTEIPIQTPTVPLVTDGTKAHIGEDLTVSFTDDLNWRNGINRITVRHFNQNAGTIEVPSSYYDITQPGKITFNKDLFKTNSPVGTSSEINSATIVPGGANFLPQNYQFVVYSQGADGTIYPGVIIGKYTGDNSNPPTAAQAVGYKLTFDSQGGSAIPETAVSYNPSRNKVTPGSSDFYISSSKPVPTRPGYQFLGWYNEPQCTTVFNAPAMLTGDKTVYAKWQLNIGQNYSLVDPSNPSGPKFDGTNGSVSGRGWVLGEGDLNINIPDYATNVSWLTSKIDIQKIEKTFYKVKPDGTNETVRTTEVIDPSTYDFTQNGTNGTLSFTTATEKFASEHPDQKFAFDRAPAISASPYAGYQLTVTSTGGQTISIPDVKLGYRSHIDLNGGTTKTPNDSFFWDRIINGKLYGISMESAANKLVKDDLTIMPNLYKTKEGTSESISLISQAVSEPIIDNTNLYVIWVKPAPTVAKDVIDNIVGSDITLPFIDDGIWKTNIKKVSIGSKDLVINSDYRIVYDSTTKKGSIVLDNSLFAAGQKFNVTIVSEGYRNAVVTDQVIGYRVSFESNGGDAINPIITDSRITKPIDPIKAGFKFMGWYTDGALTTPYDFASIVTKPITLYAKYALATSIVSPDTSDNALGNDMTLEFSDVDWAKAIIRIKLAGSIVDQAKYTIDTKTGTITFDKSLFVKTGDFNITISATDYADVTVIQKIVNGYNIHFVVKGENVPFEVKDQIVTRRITEPVVYGYDLTWFADENCTLPWVFTNSIYSAKTIYGKWSPTKFTVIFDGQNGGLVQTETAEYNTTITAPTAPTRAGYTFLGWYKDAAGKTAWNFATDEVEGDVRLYAKWAAGVENNGHYNKDVIITFNEATAKLDGKDYTSGTAVTSEGNHTLVVTDASGYETTVKFTIDKTTPVVTGVSNNGLYNKDVIITFNEGTATLDGNEFTSGKTVASEGSHTLVVTDAAGNETTVNFTIDKTAPNAPTVDTVTSKTTEVTGTAEANSTIVVKEGKDTIGIGKTDQDGKFTISIEKQKKGTNLYVTAKDQAGNVSAATKVTVSK
ncbi:S8 family serine peptidase [Bacillus sp. 7884-1]|uniref:S8 family serine peptidase n=1 Tax=Bacillus sp. 7884-1 TaxID=2021693 RepID=UPI001C52BC90|nr:S8 family serine peptidase [Bacillus sp. 7884-1]